MNTPTSNDPAFPELSGDGVSQATSRTSEFGRRAAAAIDERRGSIADGIESAASQLHEKAERLPLGETVAGAAHTTADAMGRAADYVREQDLQEILTDAQQIVKRHPGIALLTAAAVGFALARAISRN